MEFTSAHWCSSHLNSRRTFKNVSFTKTHWWGFFITTIMYDSQAACAGMLINHRVSRSRGAFQFMYGLWCPVVWRVLAARLDTGWRSIFFLWLLCCGYASGLEYLQTTTLRTLPSGRAPPSVVHASRCSALRKDRSWALETQRSPWGYSSDYKVRSRDVRIQGNPLFSGSQRLWAWSLPCW